MFNIAAGRNQSTRGDICILGEVAPGTSDGYEKVSKSGSLTHAGLLELVVQRFTLPGAPNAQIMMFVGAMAKRRGLTGDLPTTARAGAGGT